MDIDQHFTFKLADYALIEDKSGERDRVRAWNLN